MNLDEQQTEELAMEVSNFLATKNPTDGTVITALIRILAMILAMNPEEIEIMTYTHLRETISRNRDYLRSGRAGVTIQ